VAPRTLEKIVRPRRLADTSPRPLNFCVRPMRVLRNAFVMLVLAGTSVSAFAQRSSSAEDSCSRAADHVGYRTCLEALAKASLNSLALEETSTRNFLSKADETPEDIARALAAFETALQDYLHYRQTQCDYVASLAFGGNGAGDRRLLCQIELDRRRTANLKSERLLGSNNRWKGP
jgi:hypothetical protein